MTQKPLIGIVDTTFSRVDMGRVAVDTLENHAPGRVTAKRVVVPGVKDLPAAVRRFFDEGADLVIACGMVGPEEVDKTCGHEAGMGLMWLRAMLGKPVLEVFVHMDEPFPRNADHTYRRPATDDEKLKYDKELAFLARERTREHALNAIWMLLEPDELWRRAGTGQRQGYEDEGPVTEDA